MAGEVTRTNGGVSISIRLLLGTLGVLTMVGRVPAQQSAHKPNVEHDAYPQWVANRIVREAAVSPSGKFITYGYVHGGADTVVIESVDGTYKEAFPGGFTGFSRVEFTGDNQRAVMHHADSVIVLDLATHRRLAVRNGAVSASGRWLVALSDASLTVTELRTGRTRRYAMAGKDVHSTFAPSEAAVVLSFSDSLVWLDLGTGRMKTIDRGRRATQIVFDVGGRHVAFISGDSVHYVVRTYQAGTDSARTQVTDDARGMRAGTVVAPEPPWFSDDGTQLYFRVKAVESPAPRPDSLVITQTVDVWHYKDFLLQSQQLVDLPAAKYARYTAATAVAGGSVISLESSDTVLAGRPGNRYALVSEFSNPGQEYGSPLQPHGPMFVLVSLRDGRRIPLPAFQGNPITTLSAGERFVVSFDFQRQRYLSYEIATGVVRSITENIPVPVGQGDPRGPILIDDRFSYGTAGWLADDRALLVHDKYDVWQVDPRGVAAPLNLTAGYGRRHKIVFRVDDRGSHPKPRQSGAPLFLTAKNDSTKDAGYAVAHVGQSAIPMLGSIGPWWLGASSSAVGYTALVSPPIKATNADVYLIPRQTASDAPNWFLTTDLKTYRRLTNVQPQQDYNWMTSELHSWTRDDGRSMQGILYKPEDFNAAKKYPVLLYYYEEASDGLHQYLFPGLSTGPISIPWYVSHGYLVFCPDLSYRTGHAARSVAAAVESAAAHLAKLSWVDSTKMGIQGHSFGGYETMALVTLSHRFAAANAAAGISDLVSKYGTPAYGERDNTWQVEEQIFRMGTTPWERPDLYVENSPVFHADSVTTPLLLMHNKSDDNVRFGQSVEMFVALRRLQKPVWLLQYDGEGHIILDDNARRDYTLRQEQFFNHYLKGAPAPVWMTRGVPAALKGVMSGLGYDQQ